MRTIRRMRRIRRRIRRGITLLVVMLLLGIAVAGGCDVFVRKEKEEQQVTTTPTKDQAISEDLFVIDDSATEETKELSQMKVIEDTTAAGETSAETAIGYQTSSQDTTPEERGYFIHEVEAPPFTASDIPPYVSEPWVEINNGIPYLEKPTPDTQVYIILSPHDSLYRCGPAIMLAGPETIPTEERGSTGTEKPSGWHQNKYPGIVDSDPPYLLNRAHLLMFALSGLTSTTENLITGTRYFNTVAMLPTELEVVRHVEDTGHHVLYRVTPIFSGDNLLAEGVLMEAIGLEDDFAICRFAYNVQPGILIDYATGENRLAE